MTKKSYYSKNVLVEFGAAIDILCEAFGRCTPTDVLRLVGVEEVNVTRRIVIDIAESRGYVVKSSGRGYVILDW